MKSAGKFIAKIFRLLVMQKKLNRQLYMRTNYLLSDIFRVDSYVEQLSATVSTLESLIIQYERLRHISPEEKSRSGKYISLLTKISNELQVLRSSSQQMEDKLRQVEKYELLNFRISGKMIHLRKKTEKLIRKAEEVLRF